MVAVYQQFLPVKTYFYITGQLANTYMFTVYQQFLPVKTYFSVRYLSSKMAGEIFFRMTTMGCAEISPKASNGIRAVQEWMALLSDKSMI